jgi:hypothetical protein
VEPVTTCARILARAQARPGDQVPHGGEALMSVPISATRSCAAVVLTPGIVTRWSTGAIRGEGGPDRRVPLHNRRLQRLDHPQVLPQQEAMMRPEATRWR